VPTHFINNRRKFKVGAAIGLLLLSTVSALADNSKISPDLLSVITANPSASVNVIVQYNTQPQSSSGGLLGGLLGGVLNLLGGLLKGVFSLIWAVSATLTGNQVTAVSNQSNVTYVSLDRPLAAMLDYTAETVNAPYAWNSGLDGTGVGIAIIDSGIYSHSDLAGRVVYRQAFIGGVKNYDDYGHGTHVAGIVGGDGKESSQNGSFYTVKGIAPNANLIDLRVLDANGMSSDSVVIAALQQAVQLKQKYNIRVINLSLGRPIYESCNRDPLCQAVEAAWRNGIVVVTAAGNLGRNGYATVLSPGNSPHAITVGAMKSEGTPTRTDDLIASYSSRGPTYIDLTVKPDLVAPGNLVTSLLAPGSTLVSEYPGNVVPPSEYTSSTSAAANQYFTLSGTSMATPVVSGAAALMLQRDPTLTPDTIKARLMKTASKTFPLTSTATDPTTGQNYTDTYDIFTVGAGYVDVFAALNSTDKASYPATSPAVYYNPALKTAILMDPSGSVWNNTTWSLANVWGSQVVQPLSGSFAAWGTSAAWGSSAAWGDSGQWGTSAAWGDSGSFGTSAAWGDSINGKGEK